MSTMKGTFLLILLLECIHQSNGCEFVNSVFFCTTIPSEFPLGASTLVISVSSAGEINSTVFHHDNLASITSVIIRGAGITGITEGAFRSFLSLTSLTLDQNKLTDISHKWLGRSALLTELSMSENHISDLSGAMLEEFPNLNTLNLSKNRISSIQPGTFRNLTALAHLDLSDNSLTRLTSQMFSPLHNANMSLQGNQWVCSCDAEDFIEFIAKLKSRSLLLHAEDVTCAEPPALRGQPVWNISVCNATLPIYPTTNTETLGPSQSVTDAALTTFHDVNVSRPTRDIKTTLDWKTWHTLDITSIVTHPSPPYPAPNIVPMLITIIVVLCVVLLFVIILAVFYRRKRNRNIVAPKNQSQVVAQGHQKTRMRWDIETPCHMPFTGARAQSANAILSTSLFGVNGERHIDLAPSQDEENGVENTEEIRAEGVKNDSFTPSAGNVQNATSPAECENVPYLSIGTCPNETSVYKDVSIIGPVAMLGRGLHRISTWPSTAVQWKERCKRQREHEKGENVQPTWTQIDEFRVLYDLDKAGHLLNTFDLDESKVWENNGEIQQCFTREKTQEEKDSEVTNVTDHAASCSSIRDKNDLIFTNSFVNSEEVMGKDYNLTDGTQRSGTNGGSSSKQRGKAKSRGPNALSGGRNEYVFRDLLHEVVQNRGRWTRDRWRQIHMSK